MALIRVLLPYSPTDPDGAAFRAALADFASVPTDAVEVVVENRTTIDLEGCSSANAERAALAWARDHLPELEFAWFCGDDRLHSREKAQLFTTTICTSPKNGTTR
jgi:hypothetical protein